jgi:hypothetical protein
MGLRWKNNKFMFKDKIDSCKRNIKFINKFVMTKNIKIESIK